MLKTRVITALAMLAVLYLATAWLSAFYFALFMGLVLMVGVVEWTSLMGLRSLFNRLLYIVCFVLTLAALGWFVGLQPDAQFLERDAVLLVCGSGSLFWLYAISLLSGYPENHDRWGSQSKTALIGFLTLAPAWCALVQLKYLDPRGSLVFALIALVSVVDIGAYFTGKAWGYRKLAPALSPGKSWEGFWGGLCACLVLTALLLFPLHRYILPLSVPMILAVLAIVQVVAVFSVVGDLFESMLKRSQGLKDSGRSLPGHGGVLDRIDSLTSAAPVFVFSLMILMKDVSWQ